MSIRTKAELDGFQEDYLRGNFSVEEEIVADIQARISAGSSIRVAKAPVAVFFNRNEMIEYLSQLDTDYVKAFFVKTAGPFLTMAIAGANDEFDISGNDKPTDTIYLKSTDPNEEEKGLLAFRPCPPYCQDEGLRPKFVDQFYVLRLLA